MFNVGGGEVLVILLVVLIVLGPDKLPETARKIGNVVGEVRRMSAGFQNEMRAAMDDVSRPEPPRPSLESVADGSSSESEPDAHNATETESETGTPHPQASDDSAA